MTRSRLPLALRLPTCPHGTHAWASIKRSGWLGTAHRSYTYLIGYCPTCDRTVKALVACKFGKNTRQDGVDSFHDGTKSKEPRP